MRLWYGNVQSAIGHNIKGLMSAGTGRSQALAIALSTAKNSSVTGRGIGSMTRARVNYMQGYWKATRGGNWRGGRTPLARAAFNAGRAAGAGQRAFFAYRGTGPRAWNEALHPRDWRGRFS